MRRTGGSNRQQTNELLLRGEVHLALLPTHLKDRYEGYRRTADEGIRTARVDETTKNRNKYFNAWSVFLHPLGVDPYLDNVPYDEAMHHITTFGGMVRQGDVGRGNQVQAGSVSTAISAVAQTIAMDHGTSPLNDAQGNLHRPIKLMLAGFARADPPTEKKCAIGVDIPERLCKLGLTKGATPWLQAVGDWALIAFYFLLRIGEYTIKRTKNQSKQTVQFRMKDVVFFKKDKSGNLRQLPPSATEEDIMNADGATLRLTNQKNGHKNACIHQQHNGHSTLCPVRALGRRYCHIRTHTSDNNTFLSAFFDKNGTRNDITDNCIRQQLKIAGIALNYTERGIPIDRIDTHSLRAGGANALHLAGYNDTQIQKMGRWRGETFKEYIREQLDRFSFGMSTHMKQDFKFVNVEGGVLKDITESIKNQ